MKKLLALVLVLGMASLASAAYMTDAASYDDGDAIAVSAELGLVGGGFTLTVATGPGTFDLTNAAGDTQYQNGEAYVGYDPVTGPIFDPTYADWDFAWGIIASSPTSITIEGGNFSAATAFAEEVLGSGIVINANGGIGTIVLSGIANDVAVADASVAYTPEPMTMSLLGLGGLALIRRRRA